MIIVISIVITSLCIYIYIYIHIYIYIYMWLARVDVNEAPCNAANLRRSRASPKGSLAGDSWPQTRL